MERKRSIYNRKCGTNLVPFLQFQMLTCWWGDTVHAIVGALTSNTRHEGETFSPRNFHQTIEHLLSILNFRLESLKLKSLLSHERHTKWRRPSWRTIGTPRTFSVKQRSSAFLASSLSPALTIRFCYLPYSGSHVTSLHQGLSSSEWGAPSKEPGNEVEHIMYII